eukprot:1763994-Amphidinium_carterae.4
MLPMTVMIRSRTSQRPNALRSIVARSLHVCLGPEAHQLAQLNIKGSQGRRQRKHRKVVPDGG